MAPNYPAGTDALTGFKRQFKGEIAAEVYTKLGQTDYAAEIAQIKASGADSVYFFLPGGMGIAFTKQYSGSGAGIPPPAAALLEQRFYRLGTGQSRSGGARRLRHVGPRTGQRKPGV